MFRKRFKQAACLMLAVWLMGSATGCTLFNNPFSGGETSRSRVRTGWESSQRIPIRSSFGHD